MNIKFFKKKKIFKKGGIHRDPDIYWGLTLLVAFVVVIVAIIFAFNLFTTINGDLTITNDNASTQTSTIKKERIENVLEYFSRRREKSDDIIISPAPVVDPSL